jgi:hypothetical protein
LPETVLSEVPTARFLGLELNADQDVYSVYVDEAQTYRRHDLLLVGVVDESSAVAFVCNPAGARVRRLAELQFW